MYDNSRPSIPEKERKNAQIYIKLKLLTCASYAAENESELAQKEATEIIAMLETNHEDLEEILIKEEEVRQEESKEPAPKNIMLISKLFTTKTKFMDYLMDKMLNNEQDLKSPANTEISLLLLNMFKTLIDNNTNILKITQEQLWSKVSSHDVIMELIVERTKRGIKMVQGDSGSRSMDEKEKKKSEEQIMREIEGYLQENQKMYNIISKVPAPKAAILQISSIEIVDKIFSLDDLSSSYVSIYILREIINMASIFQIAIRDSEEWHRCTDGIFSHLMKIKENYQNQLTLGRILSVESDQQGSAEEQELTIGNIINYFIWNFFWV